MNEYYESSVMPSLLQFSFFVYQFCSSLCLLNLLSSDTLQRGGIFLAKTFMNIFVIYSPRKSKSKREMEIARERACTKENQFSSVP